AGDLQLSPTVTHALWHWARVQPAKNAYTFLSGGDRPEQPISYVDEDGFVFLTDRIKDLILGRREHLPRRDPARPFPARCRRRGRRDRRSRRPLGRGPGRDRRAAPGIDPVQGRCHELRAQALVQREDGADEDARRQEDVSVALEAVLFEPRDLVWRKEPTL